MLAQGDRLRSHAEPLGEMPAQFARRMIIVRGVDEVAEVDGLGLMRHGLLQVTDFEGYRIGDGRTNAAASGIFKQHIFLVYFQ